MSLYTTQPLINSWDEQDSVSSGNTVCYPAVPGDPGVAATVKTVYQRGWGGGADSIRSITGDGYVRFKVPRIPEGVAAGFGLHPDQLQVLTDSFSPFYRPQYIQYGFLFAGATIRVIEHGVVRSDVTVPYTPAAATFIEVRRSGGEIQYKVNDWTLTVANSDDEFVLRAAMFGPADFVEDPEIGDAYTLTGLDTAVAFAAAIGARYSGNVGFVATGDIAVNDEFHVLARRGRVGFSTTGTSNVTFQLLDDASVGHSASVSFATTGAELELPELVMLASDYFYLEGDMSLPELTVSGEAFGAGVLGAGFSGDLTLPPLVMSAVSYTGGVLTASLEFELDMLSSDYFYLEGVMELPPLWTYSDDLYGPDEWAMDDTLFLAGGFGTDPIVYGYITSDGLELGQMVFEVAIVFDDLMYESLMIGSSMSFIDIVNALLEADALSLSSALSLNAAEAQYAVNLDTGATTRYSNFRFLQYARAGERLFGVKSDGVYAIQGTSDDGDPIQALVRFGTRNFNATQMKRVDAVYLGIQNQTGAVYIRVKGDDGTEYTYQAIPRTGAHRASVGKGIKARLWTMDLILVDAGSAELDYVEFDVSVAPRRW